MVSRWGAATLGCEWGKRLGGRLSLRAIVAPFRYMVEAAVETSSLLQYHMALHARVLPRRQTQMESYRTHTNRDFVTDCSWCQAERWTGGHGGFGEMVSVSAQGAGVAHQR